MDKLTLQRKGYSVAALRALAQKQLPRTLFDMVDGAAGDEITMRRNEAAHAATEFALKRLSGAPKCVAITVTRPSLPFRFHRSAPSIRDGALGKGEQSR